MWIENVREIGRLRELLRDSIAERDQLREALGMAEEQQREVAKALRIDPTGDSVYLHYQILSVIDAVRTSFPTTGSR